jgi:hypothetical protein
MVLKLDCEGCEYELILDTPDMILEKFESIFIEYHMGYDKLKEKLESCKFVVKTTKPTLVLTPHLKPPVRFHGYIHAYKKI